MGVQFVGHAIGKRNYETNNTMNISYIIWGSVMICIGIFIVILQIKRFKNGLQDEWGYQRNLLMSGFLLIVMGIIMVVKSV
jgi:uncharacterized membrane protein HdeD (DUF308 family)